MGGRESATSAGSKLSQYRERASSLLFVSVKGSCVPDSTFRRCAHGLEAIGS